MQTTFLKNTSERCFHCWFINVFYWFIFTVISWDGFSGVRVVALPGDVSFAVNHGVYLTDAEVCYWILGLFYFIIALLYHFLIIFKCVLFQARVCNIIYKGSKENISCAVLPDGKVPLVCIFWVMFVDICVYNNKAYTFTLFKDTLDCMLRWFCFLKLSLWCSGFRPRVFL